MARSVTQQRKAINTVAAWAVGLLIFFPILWTILTSFKIEAQAINDPPLFFFFDWTLENYAVVQERSDYMRFLWNSIAIAGGSTLLGIIIAIPAAWSEMRSIYWLSSMSPSARIRSGSSLANWARTRDSPKST